MMAKTRDFMPGEVVQLIGGPHDGADHPVTFDSKGLVIDTIAMDWSIGKTVYFYKLNPEKHAYVLDEVFQGDK